MNKISYKKFKQFLGIKVSENFHKKSKIMDNFIIYACSNKYFAVIGFILTFKFKNYTIKYYDFPNIIVI